MKKLLLTILLLGLIGLTGCVLQPPFGAEEKDEISKAKLTEKYNLATEIKAKYELKDASLVKTDIKNPELDKYKGEPKDEVKITLGDKDKTEFVPNIELKRWNEVGFKLKPKGLESVAAKDKNLSFEGSKVKFDTPKISFEMYDLKGGEGGYNFIWILNEKPATNKVEFQIESSGLDFFYQPPLTEEYQNGYSEEFQKEILVSETQVKDLEGNVLVERPENVVGSYAVYHSTKGGMNDINGKDYKVGKAFHIFRPHIIDANGAETWGILHIENGIYSVEIPQEFLDNAVYPIKSNDTFGYTTKGVNTTSGFDNYQQGLYATASAGTVTSITGAMNFNSTTPYEGYTKFALYTKRAVSGRPETKILVSSELHFSGASIANQSIWEEASVSNVEIDAGTYWIIKGGNKISGQYNSGTILTFDNTYPAGTAQGGDEDNYTYAQLWPTTWVDNAAAWDLRTSRQYSIYATYTPSGGGAPTANTQIKSGTLYIKDGTVKIK